MPVKQTQNFQSSWLVDASSATPAGLVDFAQSLPDLGQAPTQTTINLGGSPVGTQLQGPLDEVAAELQKLGDQEFVSGSLKAQYPQANATLTISFNFGQRLISVSAQNTEPDQARAWIDAARSHFPRAEGPSQPELESLDRRVRQLLSAAEAAQQRCEAVEQRAAETENLLATVRQHLEAAQEAQGRAAAAASEAESSRGEATQRTAEISNMKAEAQANRDSTKEARDEAGPPLEAVKSFATEVAVEKQKLNALHQDTKERLEQAEKESGEILARHDALQAEIAEHLQKAVGAGLFGAFNRRKSEVVQSKWIWFVAASAFAIGQVGVILWVVDYLSGTTVEDFSYVAFGLRLAASLPILFMLLYCLRQYGRERDFEEVYAFKSALSFSLKPYLDLVQELPGIDDPKHQDFVTSTIGQVFEYPAERVREGRRSRRGLRKAIPQETIEQLATLLKTLQQ